MRKVSRSSAEAAEDVRAGKAGTDSHRGIASDAAAPGSMKGRLLLWPAAVVLLILTARWLVYALSPGPLARGLEGSAGGPRLVVVALVSLGLAALVSTLVVWLVEVGVRERQRLHPRRVPPTLRLRRLGLRAVVLTLTSSLGFGLFESYLHWRAGLGFHGLSCLVGPVHRNALPILVSLAVLAAALAEALQHLRAWARATARELLRPRFALYAAPCTRARVRDPRFRTLHRVCARPRAPPLPV
jgi:hypothetical protein